MPKKNIALICCYAAAMVSLVPCAPGKNLSGPSLDISGTATVGVLNSGSASIGTLGVTGLAALQGGVTISGTADILGNFMLLGSWVSNPETFGVSFVYDDGANGNNACFTQTVSRPAANWNWQRITATGSTSVVMQLDASNRLILTGTGENSSFIILDPNSAISVNGNDLLTQSSADTRYFPASAGLVGLNGNIGLGIATPTSRLDISGNVAIGSYAGTVAAPVNGMIVSGSVGIGTSTPMEALDVNGNINLPITSATAGQIKQSGQLLLHTTGSSNFFAGKSAGNLKIQNSAGGSGVGYSNTGIGAFSLNGIITGRCNTAFGESSAMRLTTGDDNVAIGVGALNSLSKECENVAIGVGALSSAFGVYNTVAIGNSAGRWIYGGGTNNIYIGYQAGTNGASGLYNAIAIGANSQVKKSNSFVLGGTGTYAVNVGIGTAAPNAALDVVGDIISSGTGNLMPNQTIACGSASVLTLGIADQRYIQNGTAYSGTISVSQVSGLSSVAVNGNYDSLTGVPIIPTNVSQLANDIGYITSSGTAAFAQTSAAAAALRGNIQASQVMGLASVATEGTLDYSKVTNAPSVPANISAFINDAGYVASGGTISNLALSGTTDISGVARITGGVVVTGMLVQLEEGTNKVVATAGNALLVPEQGDISMGKYINGTQPQ